MKTPFIFLCLIIGGGLAYAAQTNTFSPDKPWTLYRESDTQIKDTYTHNNYSGVEADWAGDADGDENYDDQHWTHYDHTWKSSPGGSGSRQDTDITVDWDGTVYTNATSGVMQWSPVDGIETDTANDGTVSTNLIGLPTFGDEHCIVNDPKNPPAVVYGLDGWDDDIVTNTYSEEYFRYAQTKWHLETGGKAIPGRQNLWQFNGWAKKILDKRAVPMFGGANMKDITNTAVAIGSIGSLMADGTYWKTLPDGQSMDATPTVSGPDFYAFGVGAQKYALTILASSSTTNADLSTNTPEFCVGQKVSFVLNGLPLGNIVNMVGHWSLPTKYVNEQWQHYSYDQDGNEIPYGSVNYRINSALLDNTNQTFCWFINGQGGHVMTSLNLNLSNGQYVSVAANGDFTVYRPAVTNFNLISAGTPACDDGDAWVLGIHYFGMVELNNIHFTATIQCADFSGSANWRQLDKRWVFTSNPADALLQSTYGDYWLDNTDFYNTQGADGDASAPPDHTPVGPGLANPVDLHDNPGIGYRVSVTSISDSFKTYLVFKPAPDNSDDIWVTLGRVDWGWSADAAVNFLGIGGASLTSSSTNPPAYTDTDEFPQWTSVIHNK